MGSQKCDFSYRDLRSVNFKMCNETVFSLFIILFMYFNRTTYYCKCTIHNDRTSVISAKYLKIIMVKVKYKSTL